MNNDVRTFIEMLRTDKTFQDKIVEAANSYNGEKTDDAIWEKVIAPVASETGYDVTFEDYKAYVNEVISSEEISIDELETVAGGITVCLIIGFGSKPETGSGSRIAGQEEGLGACAFIGIGLGGWGTE